MIGEHNAVPQEVEVVMGRTLRVCSRIQICVDLGDVADWY